MNKDMLALAEKNKAASGASNVDFVEARITSIPLPDGTADVIISNCVINLVPETEKRLVFNEMFCLLGPGGRVAVSDILARKVLPAKLQKSVAAYIGCVAGASLVSQYQRSLSQAGFKDAIVQDAGSDLNVYLEMQPDGTVSSKQEKQETDNEKASSACCESTARACCSAEKKATSCCAPQTSNTGCCETSDGDGGLAQLAAELEGTDLNDWVGSYKIFAIKPE